MGAISTSCRYILPELYKKLGSSDKININYDVIKFRNGYRKIAPEMVVEYKGMGIDDGRYAIQLGKILSKLKKRGVNSVIMEASSHGLEQNRLDGLLFNSGIFTNLSQDHLDYHKNLNNYFITMTAPLTEYDIEQYGYKVEDVKKINFYITAFSVVISCFFTISFYYINT